MPRTEPNRTEPKNFLSEPNRTEPNLKNVEPVRFGSVWNRTDPITDLYSITWCDFRIHHFSESRHNTFIYAPTYPMKFQRPFNTNLPGHTILTLPN